MRIYRYKICIYLPHQHFHKPDTDFSQRVCSQSWARDGVFAAGLCTDFPAQCWLQSPSPRAFQQAWQGCVLGHLTPVETWNWLPWGSAPPPWFVLCSIDLCSSAGTPQTPSPGFLEGFSSLEVQNTQAGLPWRDVRAGGRTSSCKCHEEIKSLEWHLPL